MTQTTEAPASAGPEAPDPAGAVALAYVHPENVSFSWHHSIVGLLGYDIAAEGRIFRGGFVAIHCGTDGLVDARNKAVASFLTERSAEWLFWIDTDMGFAPDTVERLLAAADPVHRPVVGALAFSQRQYDLDGVGGWRTRAAPTLFDWREEDGKRAFSIRWDYPQNTVTRVAGTGSACILIHRSAFEKVVEAYGPLWYNRIPNQDLGQMTSEDLSFCMRLAALDIPVHVHTGVKTTHHKPVWLAEEDYFRQRAIDADLERRADARPLIPGVDCLVCGGPDSDDHTCNPPSKARGILGLAGEQS